MAYSQYFVPDAYLCNVTASDPSFWQHLVKQIGETSRLEWFGTITGFLCVYLAAKQHILNWPISIFSVGAYAILFYNGHLYGDAALQIYFFGTAVYGWYYWLRRKQEHEKPIANLSGPEIGWVVLSIALLSGILGVFLDKVTDSDVPYADGFCTAMSFVAQFLMTRKVLQNWIIWIVVDICYVPLYLYKDFYMTAVLYLLFLLPAAMGYIEWKRTWQQAKQ